MASVTIRVLEGLERGRLYNGLVTPITIGREDDNDIQLNDDRVSRFHAKLQDDGGRVILTDLDSTNGTRVNGHPVQVKVLQTGDLLMIGRCVLLFGDHPNWSAEGAQNEANAGHQTAMLDESQNEGGNQDVEFLSPQFHDDDPLFPQGAPALPTELRPLHRAQLSDMLAYFHEQIGTVLANATQSGRSDSPHSVMVCPKETWQQLIGLQVTLANYLREIANPEN